MSHWGACVCVCVCVCVQRSSSRLGLHRSCAQCASPPRRRRAYSFRSVTEAQRKQRLRLYTPPASTPLGPAALAPSLLLQGLAPAPPHVLSAERLGWQPLELASVLPVQLPQRLHQLLSGCRWMDHSVPGVSSSIGGSAAGYARWEAFRRRGLPLYAARRNDAMQRDGVSRLSAYHHFGMVSPFKVAREAALDKTAGATKFLGGRAAAAAAVGWTAVGRLALRAAAFGGCACLPLPGLPPPHLPAHAADECLVWREIGFNLCLHRHHDLHTLAALPK